MPSVAKWAGWVTWRHNFVPKFGNSVALRVETGLAVFERISHGTLNDCRHQSSKEWDVSEVSVSCWHCCWKRKLWF